MGKLLEYTGLISAFLILSGVVKFYIYYKQFGILILRFVEASEIVTLFMDNLMAFLTIVLLATACILLLTTNNLFGSVHLRSHFLSLVSNWVIFLIIFIIVSISAFFYKEFASISYRELILILVAFLISIIILPLLFLVLTDVVNANKNIQTFPNGVFLVLMCLSLLIYSIFTAFNEARKVLHDNYYAGTTIYFKDKQESITSNENTFFVGMTKSYLFVYDRLRKQSTVYKIDDLKMIEFPQK